MAKRAKPQPSTSASKGSRSTPSARKTGKSEAEREEAEAFFAAVHKAMKAAAKEARRVAKMYINEILRRAKRTVKAPMQAATAPEAPAITS